ncbi:T9SS type A sorting domain-containing protein [Altibacter sp. HG106]|uniref:T9SS type A sorting domain-containing protein n=1 Tax=Altibacter sp. HG106 TaxID=3023937 RepID=UPI002350F401|nr:T9SS type A sorting domain-containing protein [Altibacter sp. HG106]MDC7994490.1 T9SS type A sorting domain-containing protein [Altibacter sp. HG106]
MKKQLTLFLWLLAGAIITVSAQGLEIYVSDAGNFNNPPWQILKFDADGSNGEVFITEELGWPQDILFLPDRNEVLISNLTTGLINRHVGRSGDYQNVFAEVDGGPTRMKIGSDGLIYVLQWQGNGRVLRYQQDGTFVDEFTTVGVPNSIGLDWDAAGNLYVSSFNGGTVRQFDSSGNDLGLFIENDLTGPTNIWFEDNGDLLVLDWSGGSVDRFDSNGDFLESFTTDISQPEGIDQLPNGDYIVGNGQAGGNGSVRVFDASGTTVEDVVPAGALDLLQPNAVVLFDSSTLQVSDVTPTTPWIHPTIGDTFRLTHSVATSFDEWIVFDLRGTVVSQQSTDQLTWDASAIASGVYFVQLRNSTSSITQKLVVRH